MLQAVIPSAQALDALPSGSAITQRERDVGRLVLAGGTSREIAVELGISARTVEGHRGRLMRKLGVANQRALVARLAMEQGVEL